jgi:serine phosphatase RsbU (regulator of sigma subunit)
MKKQGVQEARIDELNSRLWNSRYKVNLSDKIEASAVLKKAIKARYQKGIAYARLNIAVYYFLHSKNDIALENITASLTWFANNPSEPGYPSALNLKGNLHESFGDYEKALQLCLQAYKLSTEINDREIEAEICSQLGLIYTRLCSFDKAHEYYQRSLKFREEMKDENAVASSLNRLGMVMRLTNKYNESLDYYFRSLGIRQRNKQDSSIPWTMLGIASTYEEMKNNSKALEYYEYVIIGGDKRCTLQCLMGMGRIYSLTGDSEKAEESLDESLRIARDLRALSLMADAYSALAKHYESTHQVGKALKNFKLYQKVRESIQSAEVQNRLRNIEISNAIEKSENEKEIYRLKHVELKAAYDIIEEKDKYITSSINYASRIQQAILPEISEIKGLRNKCFVLYIPKEIVSGDFYWFNNQGDKLIVVAGDCTGHGVPGALMSMLGISLLEGIVNKSGILESGQILSELRKEIQRTLHQKGDKGEPKDGLDISLCIIDRTKNIIQYSGAYNNLYLIRDENLIEYQADRMPVGIFELPDNVFKSQNIPYKTGDLIYMFSDGYADQIGGPDHKKFRYALLKTLLIEIHKLPLQQQKRKLEKKFIEWKKDYAQRDDVLILGLRI